MKQPRKKIIKRITKVVILGFILNNKKQVLVTQRFEPHIPDAHLKWDVPGGTNEFGESLEQTLQREVKEETGLTVKTITMLPHSISRTWNHRDYLQHTLVFGFLCRAKKGTVHTNDPKIVSAQWMTFPKMKRLDLLSTTRSFLPFLFDA